MGFELESPTTARVVEVRTLTSKDRQVDEKPGAQLLLAADFPIAVLAMFDIELPEALYRLKKETPKGQAKLEGMESAELSGIGAHIKRLPWKYEQTGCVIVIDRGLGGKSNITLSDCLVHSVTFHPKQSSVTAKWKIDAPALSDATRGTLSGLKSTDIELTISLPEVQQEDLDGKGRAARKRSGPTIDGSKGHPGVDAAKAAEQQRQAQASKDKLDANPNNPFPKGGAKTDADATAEFIRQHTPPAPAPKGAPTPKHAPRRARRGNGASTR